MLDIIQVDPTLYLEGIQQSMKNQLSLELSRSTIYNEITERLHLHWLVARTVDPAQCPFKRAQYSMDVANFTPEYLVFTGKQFVYLVTS
jgi:hypothetical protein